MRRRRNLAMLVALTAGAGGCGSGANHGRPGDAGADAGATSVGRTCDLNVGDASFDLAGTTTINPLALECAGRLCLEPAAMKDPGGTGPLCTAFCQTDDDCANAEAALPSDPSDHRCRSGFICTRPILVGDFCCEKMCVCRDFVVVPPGGFPMPAVCFPDSGSSCRNVP